jgi:hypothetical protein
LTVTLIFDYHRKTLKLAKARITEEQETKRRKLDIQERELRLREFQAGLITKGEYRQDRKKKKDTTTHAASSDWDFEKLDDELDTEISDKDSVDGWDQV